ncbi:adhesion G protein-coupled receptor F5-like [Micropterus dolomieu]|uniref:adhesion G protein-coupled receptor F5-like n=1 Tax=Micropterus dolomieu TaxID=147949 RepID=UPI001E8EC8BB|nr:adhesion G protein-coupled receptor F5-like [Micropterus dolomieu]
MLPHRYHTVSNPTSCNNSNNKHNNTSDDSNNKHNNTSDDSNNKHNNTSNDSNNEHYNTGDDSNNKHNNTSDDSNNKHNNTSNDSNNEHYNTSDDSNNEHYNTSDDSNNKLNNTSDDSNNKHNNTSVDSNNKHNSTNDDTNNKHYNTSFDSNNKQYNKHNNKHYNTSVDSNTKHNSTSFDRNNKNNNHHHTGVDSNDKHNNRHNNTSVNSNKHYNTSFDSNNKQYNKHNNKHYNTMSTETTYTTTQTMTTTSPSTTTTTPMTTTTMPKTTTTTQVRNLNFTMDLVYDSTYNDQRSEVYRNTNFSIQEQCNKHISTLVSVNIIGFKSGSTIVDYTVRANSINDMEIAAVTSGVFTQLGKIYPVIFDSPAPLTFNPPSVIFGESVTVTCGPPPKDLNFSTISNAEWTLNGTKILEDNEHHFGTANGAATLTVKHFFITDVGRYQCMLKDSGSRGIFRQTSNGIYTFQNKPLIQVKPMKQLVQCGAVTSVTLQCSVNSPYNVVFNKENSPTGPAITYPFPIPSTCENQIVTCQVINHMEFNMNIKLVLTNDKLICVNDPVYGSGTLNYVAEAPCEPNYVGAKTAVCGSDGQWGNKQDNCVLQIVQELFQQSQNLNSNSLPGFLEKLSSATVSFTEQVVNSPGTINAIVQILNNVANVSLSPNITITETSMQNVLLTAGVLTINGSKASWGYLNGNDTSNITATQRKSVSSAFLQSLENITSRLTNDSFNIDTPSILLNKTTFTNTFMADFDSSVEIDIPTSDGRSKFITAVTFASMDNVLPARDKGNSSIYVINGRVVLVQSSGTVDNVSFTFDIINNTLGNAQCVFWNFSLFSGLGGWDNGGCVLVSNNTNVTCNCNHLTSFSILMSPYSKDDIVLDYITYIGVGISMASLVICLIIEAIIWRKIRRNTTSYLRHVSIVNIAVSLLIADIWFIIGAAISDAKTVNQSACTAATFFIHFFYLALFFWMLASALLLFYRTVSVFDGGLSKTSMLAIGFSLGYGGPLIIAVITIAVTAPQKAYIQDAGVCWLNWVNSQALLAFVIPALTIVVINLLILLVVIYKMLRRRVGDSSQAAERHVMVIIARSLAFG